ncbi:MAG TPA: putative nucleotidyltransferase substrate binding domain-containing protein [Geobacteraceae bacterium]
MPLSQIAPELAPNDFIVDLLQRVKRLLPYLDREEVSRVLVALRGNVDNDIAWLQEGDARQLQLVTAIASSTSYDALARLHDDLNQFELERFLKIQSVPILHQSCTEYRDLLAIQALTLVTRELEENGQGQPPVAFALISMGSDGREEQTLITDQDYLIVYDDDGGESADEYFRGFSELLVERLAEIGFKKCTGDIMPSNPTWRGSFSQWKRKLLAIVRYEYEDYAKNLMDLIVLSDARYVGGDRDLAMALIRLIRGLEQDYFHALWGMAKAATEMRLALGFLKRIWTEGSGDHKGEFNLKLLAWAPLVMNVRILAINQGIPATNTLQRIEQLVADKSFSPAMARGLTDAYLILTRHRILLQIKVIKGIQHDSYHLNPYQLPTAERERLRHAMLRIEELQKVIHTNFSIV